MVRSLLDQFGDRIERVEKALEALRNVQGVIVTDDEERENEGDLVFAAESITPLQMNMLIRNCTGIVCLCLTADKVQSLSLSMMVPDNSNCFGTAFTVSIDAAKGISTGVSASDRVATVKAAIRDDAQPVDLNRPGHVFPLKARPGGVFERRGHTEASVDLARLAGLKPYGVLCELMNPDGTMAHLPEVVTFALSHNLMVVSIEDIIFYRTELNETFSENQGKCKGKSLISEEKDH